MKINANDMGIDVQFIDPMKYQKAILGCFDRTMPSFVEAEEPKADIEVCGNAKKEQVPIWEKSYLTLAEAALYTNLGVHRLRSISDEEDCSFVLWVGRKKRLLNRRKLDQYLEECYSI